MLIKDYAEGVHKHLPDYRTALEVFNAMLGEKISSMKVMYDAGIKSIITYGTRWARRKVIPVGI